MCIGWRGCPSTINGHPLSGDSSNERDERIRETGRAVIPDRRVAKSEGCSLFETSSATRNGRPPTSRVAQWEVTSSGPSAPIRKSYSAERDGPSGCDAHEHYIRDAIRRSGMTALPIQGTQRRFYTPEALAAFGAFATGSADFRPSSIITTDDTMKIVE